MMVPSPIVTWSSMTTLGPMETFSGANTAKGETIAEGWTPGMKARGVGRKC
jgi:hypothetical protein